MSADSQRLKSALRRIVLESPELRELLGDSDNRGDQSGSAGVGASEAEESRLCCDGTTTANANPGTSERDPDAESQDGLDPNDPADLTSGDGTLSGVTDCATGEPICMDGSGFIPPEGWDDPQVAPVEPTWVLGEYGAVVDTPENTKEYYASYELAVAFVDAWCRDFLADPPEDTITSCGDANDGREAEKVLCDDRYDAAYCDPDNPPLVESWPSDGCVNLAIKGGKIVGSKYDPENSAGDYSAPRDEIQLCSGADQIGLKPAANGGWKTINASTNSGYLWDSQGNKIAHIDGNEYSDPDV